MSGITNGEHDSKVNKARCIACQELIRPGASLCPHCRSPQSAQHLKTLGTVFKWIGGLTAIITMIMGVKQVGGIVMEWNERRIAVEKLVLAARLQTQMRHYPEAWNLLEQAIKITPASDSVLDQKTEVAMNWLRDITWQKKPGEKFTDLVKPLLPVLYLSTVRRQGEEAADVLAHIGRANQVRIWDDRAGYNERKSYYEIDAYFQKALEQDPDNTYAHLFWGMWALDSSNANKYEGGELEKAKRHFAVAVQTGKHQKYVNENRLQALSAVSTKMDINKEVQVNYCNIEAIKAANEMRKTNQELAQEIRSAVLETFERNMVCYHNEAENVSFEQQLFNQLQPTDVLATFLWLSKGIDFSHVTRPFDTFTHKFITGVLMEATGDLNGALEQYKSVIPEPYRIPLIKCLDMAIRRVSAKLSSGQKT